MGNWPYVAHFLARSGCLGQRPDEAEIIIWLKQFLLTSVSWPGYIYRLRRQTASALACLKCSQSMKLCLLKLLAEVFLAILITKYVLIEAGT